MWNVARTSRKNSEAASTTLSVSPARVAASRPRKTSWWILDRASMLTPSTTARRRPGSPGHGLVMRPETLQGRREVLEALLQIEGSVHRTCVHAQLDHGEG